MNRRSISSLTRRVGRHLSLQIARAAFPIFLLGAAPAIHAASASWVSNPTGKTWNTMANWNPVTVPNGRGQIATFDFSNRTSIFVTTPITIANTVFNAGASAYTIAVASARSFTFSGLGVTNNSGVTQTFLTAGQLNFTRSSAAGDMTFYAILGGGADGALGGLMLFQDLGNAGTGTFLLDGATVANAGGGEIDFSGNGNAGSASFTVKGANLAGGSVGTIKFTSGSLASHGTFDIQGGTVAGAAGGSLSFADMSNANQALITNEGADVAGATGGTTTFLSGSAANSTLIANGGTNGGGGGTIRFEADAKGGAARVEIFGNGGLDISAASGVGTTIGSLEGDGDVALGTRELTVGANTVNTTFSGLIHDSGSLTKTGSDSSLGLAGANTYTGGTQINAGVLLAQNKTGSCTGSGPVLVNGGTLGSQGTIAGTVTIGAGDGTGGFLYSSKGINGTATLTIQGLLTFNLDGTLIYKVTSGRNPTSDKIVAQGVVIASGATFTFLGVGNGTIPVGRVITAIDNTSVDPIAGTFANLADGSTFTANGISYQVSYQGGDGNDLTLTVVP